MTLNIFLCSEWSLKIMYENGTVMGTTPVGESCSPSSSTNQEKCARPTIKECVDRNKYCNVPEVQELKYCSLYIE